MAVTIQSKRSGDVVVPAAGAYAATVIPGLRVLEDLGNIAARRYAGGSASIEDGHLTAILALPEGNETRRAFLDAIVTTNLPGYAAPSMLRATNNTPMGLQLPRSGSYSEVIVPSRGNVAPGTALVFAAHKTALESHPEPAVQRALSLLSFETV